MARSQNLPDRCFAGTNATIFSLDVEEYTDFYFREYIWSFVICPQLLPITCLVLPCEQRNIRDRAEAIRIGVTKTRLIYCKEKIPTCWRLSCCDEGKVVREIPLQKTKEMGPNWKRKLWPREKQCMAPPSREGSRQRISSTSLFEVRRRNWALGHAVLSPHPNSLRDLRLDLRDPRRDTRRDPRRDTRRDPRRYFITVMVFTYKEYKSIRVPNHGDVNFVSVFRRFS